MVVSLSGVPGGLLPPTIAGPIFSKVAEQSAVQQLARKIPLSLSASTNIPVPMDIGVAGWVAEGAAKPVSNGGVGIKTMTGKKVALIVPVSDEVVRTNAAGVYEQLQQDLPVAIARAFDHAAIHGVDLRTGGAGPFTDYLKATTNTVEIGTANQATGGIYADFVNAEKLVVDDNYDFTGWAVDPRVRPLAKLSVDTTGRPIWVDSPQQGLNSGTLIGYPAYYNRGVSGGYRRNGNRVQVVALTGVPTGGTIKLSGNGATTGTIAFDATVGTVQTAVRTLGGPFTLAVVTGSTGAPWTVTLGAGAAAPAPLTLNTNSLTGGTAPNVTITASTPTITSLRAIGGDWSQAAWGQGMDLTIKVSDSASYVDENGTTVSAFQNNLVLLLVEAHYGFVVGDPNGFVAVTDAS